MNERVIHNLGVALCVMTAMWWIVETARTAGRRRCGKRRLAALTDAPPRKRKMRPGGGLRELARRWAPVCGVACAGFAAIGGPLGVLTGLAAGYASWRWARRPKPEPDFDAQAAARELPLAADLLAACLAAGAGPVEAARAVGLSLDGPVGTRLSSGAAELRLGGPQHRVWQRLAALPGAGPLARLLERATESGAPAAEPVARLATEARAEWGRAATARVRRAAVLVTAPVGLCFLPAFIALGVLPVVIGLAGELLKGGAG